MHTMECPRCERILTLPKQEAPGKIRCQACQEVFMFSAPARDVDDREADWLSDDLRCDDGEDLAAQVQVSFAVSATAIATGRATK